MIKGFFFGKLLKPLFIISLISFFGFCLNFSDASYTYRIRNNGVYGFSPLNNSLDVAVFNKGQLGTQKFGNTQRLIALDSSSILSNTGEVVGYNKWFFFWSLGQKPYFLFSNHDFRFQGFFKNYYLCDQLYGSENLGNGADFINSFNCQSYAITDNFKTEIGALFSGMTSSDIWAFNYFTGTCDYTSQYTYSQICFSCNQFNKSICFSAGDGVSSYGCTPKYKNSLSGSLNISYSTDFTQINSSYILESPAFDVSDISGGGPTFSSSSGSNFNGDIIVSSGYTNHDMVEGFECVGLQPSLCYGGFDINNIFKPGESFEDFTGYIAGQGATIFEIYDLYSGSFSSLNQFLNTVLTRYQNGQINSFKTEPKALLMLGAQMNTAGFKTSYIVNYCDLLLNRNNDIIYTGNSVDDLRVQSCLRNKKTREGLKNSEGQDILGQNADTGIFGSGENVDFDPDTFFSTLMNEITTKLDKTLSGGAVGVIPGYIIVFTLAIIFIRLISH